MRSTCNITELDAFGSGGKDVEKRRTTRLSTVALKIEQLNTGLPIDGADVCRNA